MKTIWKPIVGYEGIYEISNLGKVKSFKFWYGDGEKERILTGYKNLGYMTVGLSKNCKTVNVLLHRLVADAFIPNPENKPYINHKDCNKLNNGVSNLEWVTHSENMEHAFANNRFTKGEKRPLAKLTEEQVKIIKQLDLTQRRLASMFGISQMSISKIKSNKIWKHVV